MMAVGLMLAGLGCHRETDGAPGAKPAQSQRSLPAASQAASGGTGGAVEVTPKISPVPEARALSRAFTTAAHAVRPSVVRLDVESRAGRGPTLGGGGGMPDIPPMLRRFFEFDRGGGQLAPVPTRGTGSGLLLDGAGHILTNNHVIHGATKVTIQLADGRSFDGKVVGTDPLTDVGVVRVEKPPAGLTAARLGNSDDLEIGEWVIAVGSPLGMDQTVTVGVVSGVGETGSHFRFESGERVRKYIQTDAKINPGNSGGPLVNLEGEVIGVNTLINVGPGGSYGFAIPINQARQVAQALIKEGRVRYPYIGVTIVGLRDAPEDVLQKLGEHPKDGVLVSAVTPGGPAAQAGIEPGEVITKVGARDVKTAADVLGEVSEHKIGETVSIGVARGGKERAVEVTIGELPTTPDVAANEQKLGIALQTLTAPVASSLGLEPRIKGAVVTEVQPESPAERAGLGVGDVIREIDRKPIATADQAVAALRAGSGSHLLRVTNGSGTRFVTLSPTS
jgi:serine protease Do